MTTYNGSKECAGTCGGQISPVRAMLSDKCPSCAQAARTALYENRMMP